MGSSTPTERPDESRDRHTEALERQAEALERLAIVSDPAYRGKRRLAARVMGLAMLAAGVVLGTYEFVAYVIDNYERRSMVSNWVEASREMFEVEGSAAEAGALLERAAELAPQNARVVTHSAYIDGMGVVERLVNLDRPFNNEDVEAFGRAMAQAVMLERVEPNQPSWAILRGQLALAAHEPDRAQAFLERALVLDPSSAFATLRLALVHLHRSQVATDEATRAAQLAQCRARLDRALALNPKLKWGHLWRGTIALEVDHDPEAAVGHFKTALALDPRFANAWVSLGSARETSEDLRGAEDAYVKALQLRPDSALALVGLAYVYGAQDRYEIGLRYARRATDADAGSLKAWNMRGLLARELAAMIVEDDADANAALVQEAIDSYSRALDLDPRSGDAYIERSNLNRLAGRVRDAGDDARNAVSFAPTDPYAWNALAKFQAAVGLADKAEETFGKVLELDPAFDTAYLDRAECRRARGDKAGASADLEQALTNATDDFRADVLLTRARCRSADGEHELALADFVAARTLQPALFDAWMGEAIALQALGREAESKSAATKAVELHPADAAARALAGRP